MGINLTLRIISREGYLLMSKLFIIEIDIIK
jgi:hypothetical protein